MESSGRNRAGLVIETVLFYLRHRYLAATECLLFLCLYEMADEGGRGYVSATSLAKCLGRSPGRCRTYLKRLERHGLLQTGREPDLHGVRFQLETAVTGAKDAERQIR